MQELHAAMGAVDGEIHRLALQASDDGFTYACPKTGNKKKRMYFVGGIGTGVYNEKLEVLRSRKTSINARINQLEKKERPQHDSLVQDMLILSLGNERERDSMRRRHLRDLPKPVSEKKGYTRSTEKQIDDKLYGLGIMSERARVEIMGMYAHDFLLEVALPSVDNISVRIKDIKVILVGKLAEFEAGEYQRATRGKTFADMQCWNLLWTGTTWHSVHEEGSEAHGFGEYIDKLCRFGVTTKLTRDHRYLFDLHKVDHKCTLYIMQSIYKKTLVDLDTFISKEAARLLMSTVLAPLSYTKLWQAYMSTSVPEKFKMRDFAHYFFEAAFASPIMYHVKQMLRVMVDYKPTKSALSEFWTELVDVGEEIKPIMNFSDFLDVFLHNKTAGVLVLRYLTPEQASTMMRFVAELVAASSKLHYATLGCYLGTNFKQSALDADLMKSKNYGADVREELGLEKIERYFSD